MTTNKAVKATAEVRVDSTTLAGLLMAAAVHMVVVQMIILELRTLLSNMLAIQATLACLVTSWAC
jgi:hypothetical protein